MALGKQATILLSVFIGVIIAVAFFQTIAQTTVSKTSTVELVNYSLGTVTNVSFGGDSIYLTDYRAISSPIIINESGDIGFWDIGSGNYTITNNVVDPTTGGLSVRITPEAGDGQSGFIWNISGTAQPVDYVGGASRSLYLVTLIIIVIGIIIFALKSFVDSEMFRRFS